MYTFSCKDCNYVRSCFNLANGNNIKKTPTLCVKFMRFDMILECILANHYSIVSSIMLHCLTYCIQSA